MSVWMPSEMVQSKAGGENAVWLKVQNGNKLRAEQKCKINQNTTNQIQPEKSN